MIAAVLTLNATIRFFQEHKAQKPVQALMQLAAPRSTVRRYGEVAEVESADVVPGDVVLLDSGVRVACASSMPPRSRSTNRC